VKLLCTVLRAVQLKASGDDSCCSTSSTKVKRADYFVNEGVTIPVPYRANFQWGHPLRPFPGRWMNLKRTHSTANLVSYEYSTSEDEDQPGPPKEQPKSPSPSPPIPPSIKKRKLPALPAHLAPAVPTDDPSKHQGRTRTTPHVDGQWAAHVYVPLALRGTLRRVVERAVELAKGEVTGLRVLGGGTGLDSVAEVRELHISLTRPFFLRAHQREDMKRAVRDAARAQPP